MSDSTANYKIFLPVVAFGLLFNAYVFFAAGIVSKELPADLFGYIGTFFLAVIVPYLIFLRKVTQAQNFVAVFFWTILGTAASSFFCFAYLPVSASEKILLLPLSWISLWIAALCTLPIKKRVDNSRPSSVHDMY